MPTLSAIQLQLKQHEQWLIDLRQDSCMTLAKIQTELESQKRIGASLHQLEIYFRNLGQRKNLSRAEWIRVFRALDSQKAFGRIYDLYISEKLITEQSLQKKRKNAKPAQPLASCLADADQLLTQLPHRVTVALRGSPRSSGSRLEHTFLPQPVLRADSCINMHGDASMILDNTSPNNDARPEPNAIMTNTDTSLSSLGSQSSSASTVNESELTLPLVNMATYSAEIPGVYHGFDLLMGTPSFGPNIALADLEMDFGASYFIPSPIEDFSSSLQCEGLANQDGILAAGTDYTNPTSVTLSETSEDLNLIESARLLVEGSGSVICRRERSTSRGSLPTAEELLSNLQSLMGIETADWDCNGPLNVIGGPGLFTDGFSQLLLFSTVNNFAGIGAIIPMELAIKFIDQHEPTRSTILDQFRIGASTIFSRALAERLLGAAIEACDAKTVHDLLALEIVKPDDIVCTENLPGYNHVDDKSHRLRTAIERASILRHFDTVDLLLRFGADVNKTYEDPGSQSERGGLECAISLWGQYRPIDLKLVDLLLNNDATVSSRLVEAAVRWGDTGLIEKLMSRHPPSRHRDCFFQVLIDAAEYLKNDAGYKVIRQIMRACRETHQNECVGSNQTLFAKAMVKAARRKNRELMDLLLPHGGQRGLDSALTAASRSGSHSLIHLLLAHGARGDGPACKVDTYDNFITTPLAEAIRGDDAELVGLFKKVGAWDRIGEPDRLEAALQAIAESGNVVYLVKVLDLVPNPNPRALTSPLNAAIKGRHEEVALKLLEADADINWLGAKSPLLEALRSRSQSITWAILEHDVRVKTDDSRYLLDETPLEAATAWGDPEIIKALFFMGANINTCRHEPPLSIAIQAGERSLIDLMINLGADLGVCSERYLSPLAAAALVGDAETATYLLDHGADPADEQAVLNAHIHERRILSLTLQEFRKRHPKGRSGFGGRVLHHGLQTHDEALLDLCLNAGFDVNSLTSHKKYGTVTALGLAIKIHHGRCLGLIFKLLNAGGDANVPTSERREQLSPSGHTRVVKRVTIRQTALLDAIETKSLPLVELLISNGADVRKEAKLGLKRTPLQKACEVASHTIVDLLLAHSADVNASPAARGGATALQLASKAGSTRIAKNLLAMGANVNAPGVRIGGRSAIEYAAEYGRLNMIPVLFNAAGGRFPGGQYESAMALAQENGHSACAVLLRSLASGNQGLMDDSIL